MASVKRAIENSLGSDENGREADRIAEIREVANPAKRAGLLAVHGAVTRFPATIASHFGLNYESMRLSRLDSGLQSDVFRLGSDTVLKVIKEHDGAYNPVVLTRTERNNLAAELREQHDVMAGYLGSPVIPHDIKIGRHPTQHDRMAILITQPFCEIDFLQLSDDEEDIASLRQRLETAQGVYPNVISELSSIALGSRSMFQERQLVTDIVGRNVGVDQSTESVVIVDSQPVPPERASEHNLASMHFGRLESVLATMAA